MYWWSQGHRLESGSSSHFGSCSVTSVWTLAMLCKWGLVGGTWESVGEWLSEVCDCCSEHRAEACSQRGWDEDNSISFKERCNIRPCALEKKVNLTENSDEFHLLQKTALPLMKLTFCWRNVRYFFLWNFPIPPLLLTPDHACHLKGNRGEALWIFHCHGPAVASTHSPMSYWWDTFGKNQGHQMNACNWLSKFETRKMSLWDDLIKNYLAGS